jgi:alpha-1,3-rhamnosyl/mannosyltransferase
VLFLGTLEPRKNVGALLRAYGQLVATRRLSPKLVLAGKPGEDAAACRAAAAQAPLAGRVAFLGYIGAADRQRIYEGARVLVLPSLEEGFGMPALEAMSLGIPVIASARGGLPELVGDAGLLIDPLDEGSIAAALDQVLSHDAVAATMAHRGLARAQQYSWRQTALAVRQAFDGARQLHTLGQ